MHEHARACTHTHTHTHKECSALKRDLNSAVENTKKTSVWTAFSLRWQVGSVRPSSIMERRWTGRTLIQGPSSPLCGFLFDSSAATNIQRCLFSRRSLSPARLPQLSIQKAVQFAQLDLAICLQPPAKMGGYNPVTKSDASVYRSHLNTSVHVSGEVKWWNLLGFKSESAD